MRGGDGPSGLCARIGDRSRSEREWLTAASGLRRASLSRSRVGKTEKREENLSTAALEDACGRRVRRRCLGDAPAGRLELGEGRAGAVREGARRQLAVPRLRMAASAQEACLSDHAQLRFRADAVRAGVRRAVRSGDDRPSDVAHATPVEGAAPREILAFWTARARLRARRVASGSGGADVDDAPPRDDDPREETAGGSAELRGRGTCTSASVTRRPIPRSSGRNRRRVRSTRRRRRAQAPGAYSLRRPRRPKSRSGTTARLRARDEGVHRRAESTPPARARRRIRRIRARAR